MTFRIRDLINGKTLIETERGRDIVAYWNEHFVRGKCDWRVQCKAPRIYASMWSDVPPHVLRRWSSMHSE